jgi:hypothetical protein
MNIYAKSLAPYLLYTRSMFGSNLGRVWLVLAKSRVREKNCIIIHKNA